MNQSLTRLASMALACSVAGLTVASATEPTRSSPAPSRRARESRPPAARPDTHPEAKPASRHAFWQQRLARVRHNLEEWYQRRLVRLTEIRNIAEARSDQDALTRVEKLETRLREIHERRARILAGAQARLDG